MTNTEVAEILIKIQRAYPLFYSNKTVKDFVGVASVWAEHIGKYDSVVVNKAVYLMTEKETEVPTIALLLRYIPQAKLMLDIEARQRDAELQKRIEALKR